MICGSRIHKCEFVLVYKYFGGLPSVLMFISNQQIQFSCMLTSQEFVPMHVVFLTPLIKNLVHNTEITLANFFLILVVVFLKTLCAYSFINEACICVSECWFVTEFFCSAENPHHEVLKQVLKRLQGDIDRDVRYFALLCPSGTDIEEVCNQKTNTKQNLLTSSVSAQFESWPWHTNPVSFGVSRPVLEYCHMRHSL